MNAEAAAGDRVIPFFALPPTVRRVIYASNAIEGTHARLRKIIRTRGNESARYCPW